MMLKLALGISVLINTANAQTIIKDKANIKNLPDITVVGKNSKSDYQQMPEIVGTNVMLVRKILR